MLRPGRPYHRTLGAVLALGASLAILAEPRTAAAAGPARIVFSGSAVGAEGEVFARQIAAFEARHPGWTVARHPTPDDADQRHHLYVQWLNAGARQPDVLQLDVVWTPEFAAAGWIRPLEGLEDEARDFFPQVLQADRLDGRLYALPLFVDVGMLYYRRDLVEAPRSLDELRDRGLAAVRGKRTRYGFVWQGARYEGLITVFLEHLSAFGGQLLDESGRVRVDEPPALRALAFMRASVTSGLVPEAALAWQEEPVRFAFQNGEAAFMRNWPYAYPLLADPAQSQVAGRVGVAPLPPGPGGRPAAALGGARLAVNARSESPAAAVALLRFLTAPEQLLERARLAGQYPARRSLYDDPRLARALPAPLAEVRAIVESAVRRPATPFYAETSAALQVELHAALTGQKEPAVALADAAARMRRILAQAEPTPPASGASLLAWWALLALVAATAALLVWRRRRRSRRAPASAPPSGAQGKAAWTLLSPALAILTAVGFAPLLWTVWESLHRHDLRLPALGRPFIGLANYAELLATGRFWAALAHTALFTAITVTAEVALGLVLALALHHLTRGRGLVRVTVLLPWALPTVVAALVWQFMFADLGVVNRLLVEAGLVQSGPAWFSRAWLAWVPLLLADIWKTTPFVSLLLLAGLQSIDPRLYEAARTDGASPPRQFWHITLPLLRPSLLVVLVFRSLDAFRVFDLVYVLTGGGPGTATEPVALYTFAALLQHLRFGYGSALSVVVFLVAFALALVYLRLLAGPEEESGR